MSDTPETRAEWRSLQWRDGGFSTQVTYGDLAHGMSDFARKLERERNQAIAELAELKEHIGLCHDALGECRASDTSELHTYFANHRDAILRYREAIADRDDALTQRNELALALMSLLQIGACVNRDADIIENKRRRKVAQDLLDKINKPTN